MATLDEEEIEIWYNQQRQQLFEAFEQEVTPSTIEQYRKNMAKLRKDYSAKIEKNLAYQKKNLLNQSKEKNKTMKNVISNRVKQILSWFTRFLPTSILLLFFITACSPSAQELDEKAQTFVHEKVQFYGVSLNTTNVANDYNLSIISVEKAQTGWKLLYLAEATVINATKSQNVTVCMNKQEEVIWVRSGNATC